MADAREAQVAWRAMPVSARAKVILRLRDILYVHRHAIAATIHEETGKPRVEAMATECLTTLDMARWCGRIAPALLAEESLRSGTLALWRKRIHITREPFGVVGIISPWNYPFMLPAGLVLAALTAGNGVVLKPSELTPRTADLLAQLCRDAGIPAALLQVVHGGGEAGAAVIEAGVDKLFFTGSRATGRRVALACAERVIPCVLELGGSDPAVVLADADLEMAASGITWGRFTNAGQTCVAPKRAIVVGTAYARFVELMRERVEALRVGDGGDLAPLITPAQRLLLEGQLEDAIARGARAIRAPGIGGETDARWFPPTLLVDVPRDARVLREETFGPLLPIVAAQNDDDAVAMANDSAMGLSASVWSRNRRHARLVAERLEAGTVVLNDVALIAGVAEVPHGGVKESGNGRAHGAVGLEEFVRSRTVVDDVFTGWRQAWWFGYSPTSAARLDGYARLAHGQTLLQRLSGIPQTLRLLFFPDRPI